jgi:hypothetical protein
MKPGQIKGMPPVCKLAGCGGRTCRHYKSVEKFPYYRCTYMESEVPPIGKAPPREPMNLRHFN